jgi:hypothetical protein
MGMEGLDREGRRPPVCTAREIVMVKFLCQLQEPTVA